MTLLISGPRQWILFPRWLAGAKVSAWHRTHAIGRFRARILFAVSLTLLVGLVASQADLFVDAFFWGLLPPGATTFLRYSNYFAGDFVIGAVVSFNLLTARYADFRFGLAAKPIVAGASCSFTLYLMHTPLLTFFNVYLGLSSLPLLGATLASVWVIAQFTENQKTRLRGLVRRIFFHSTAPVIDATVK